MARRNRLVEPVKSASAPRAGTFRAKAANGSAHERALNLAVKVPTRRVDRFRMKPIKHSLASARA